MADRFFCPDLPRGGRFTLEGDEARHVARVCRLAAGSAIEVFDGKGFATAAEVSAVSRDRVELTTLGEPVPDRVPGCRLTLATAVPKGERFDWLVEKATELGVARLIPMVSERSVVNPREAKLERLRRLSIEASKQCGRNQLLELGPPTPFTDIVRDADAKVRLLAHPKGMPAELWPRPALGSAAFLAVGPEGGFTDNEVALAREAGWTIGRLAATVLRIETAGVAGCTILLAFCGDRVE